MIQIGSDKIKEIYVGSDKINEVYYGSEKVWGEIESVGDGYWVHKDTGVKTYFGLGDVPNTGGVMSSPSWASNCSEVQIPEGVTSLGDMCFYYCSSLTSITLPEGVTSLGYACFSQCTSLTSITLREGVTSLENFCFANCTSLASITLPEGVTSIGGNCFSGCSSLTSITLPEGVTSIGESCFEGCISLPSITLPESLTSLGNYCFNGCTSLILVTVLPAIPPPLGTYVFHYVHASFNIKVQSPYVDDYKTALGWSSYAPIISAIEPTLVNGGWKHKDTGAWTEFAEFYPHYGNNEGFIDFNGFATDETESVGNIAHNISELIIREGCQRVSNIGLMQHPDTQEWLYEHLVVMDFPSTLTQLGDTGGGLFYSLANVSTIKIRALVPPDIYLGAMQSPQAKVYVPDAAVATYKSHPNTSMFAAIIFPLSDIE